MKKKKVYLFLFDGYADWEMGFITPQIAKSEKYDLVTLSLQGENITSMGGLTVIPDCKLADLSWTDAALLILPGGDAWENKAFREVIPAIREFIQQQIPVAAICGATTLLADMNLLDAIKHTSNTKEYLTKQSPAYAGQAYYQGGDNTAIPGSVTDGLIISASGSAPVEFSRDILRLLQIYDEQTINKWYSLFKHGIWQE
jgi:putative intracellular protease/amidase